VNFKTKVKLVASDTLVEWKKSAHDTLVLAIAIATWEAKRFRE
jgi:hypothetical protein